MRGDLAITRGFAIQPLSTFVTRHHKHPTKHAVLNASFAMLWPVRLTMIVVHQKGVIQVEIHHVADRRLTNRIITSVFFGVMVDVSGKRVHCVVNDAKGEVCLYAYHTNIVLEINFMIHEKSK